MAVEGLTRFRKSKSANWCSQMRIGSRIFMLEYRSNRAGKYLQLSVIIDGKRSFVILPAGWNEWGWLKLFGLIVEIVGLCPLDPLVQPRTSPSQPSSSLVDVIIPPPPPPLPGCCPKCGFKGDPATFLRPYADMVSSSVVRRGKEVSDSGITLDHAEPLEVQRRGLSFGTRRMN